MEKNGIIVGLLTTKSLPAEFLSWKWENTLIKAGA